jgi:hypothetical protein
MTTKQPFTPFWLFGWALAVAFAWLLPNHYAPWSTFHMDAWMAIVLSLSAVAVLVRSTGPAVWHGIALLTAVLALIPGLQYGIGVVLLSGTAWMASAYLTGFLLALLVGARWEAASPGQLADGLFLAIGMAALLSVALQLNQWLGLDLLATWSMGDGYGRPSANFGQPNQLATFLLWGLLAIAWGIVRRHIGVGTALFMAAYLLFGLALTQSRTTWLAIVLLVCAGWVWRHLCADRRLPWVITGLGLYFGACVTTLTWLNQLLHLNTTSNLSYIDRVSGELRPVVWSLFTDAAMQHPFFGYGWSQGTLAHLTVAPNHPALHQIFSQSHNLFLDLVLWCGLPIGLFISIYLIQWFWMRLRSVGCAQDAVLMLFLLMVANHAMLEFPLNYAYFLLPTGLIVGVVNMRLGARPAQLAGRWSLIAVCLVAVALLGLIIRDYSRVETSYQELRFEWAHIKAKTRGEAPQVLLLTQLREYIVMARLEPVSGMSADDLEWMSKVTSAYPSAGAIHKLATALALNQRPDEAKLWLYRLCKVISETECLATKSIWVKQSLQYPDIAAIPWPN